MSITRRRFLGTSAAAAAALTTWPTVRGALLDNSAQTK